MTLNETMRVLIAEDDTLINDGTAHQVMRLGYDLAGQAYDGPEAVALACQNHPSVVLMDLQMIDPDTGREDPLAGLKAARDIHERCPVAVVVLSAHESSELIRQTSEAGACGYLVKPIRDNDLDRAMTIARARFGELLHLRWLTRALQRDKEEMQRALEQNIALSGICAWCKAIRDDAGGWHSVEDYLLAHSKTTFTHGICPDCHRKMSA